MGAGAIDAGMTDILDMENVRFRWPGRQSFGLEIARFAVAARQRVMLLGPSGSGKSTLLALIAGIVAPELGIVRIAGQDIARMGAAARDRFRAENVGVIFQMFNLLPYASIIDNVVLPLSFARNRRARVARAGGTHAEAVRLLSRLGLPEELAHARSVSALSVGQQQRVAAARALIGAPELIVADEPTSALDRDRQAAFLDLLFEQAQAAGSTLVMVSHEEAFASRFDRVLRLDEILSRTGTPAS